MEQLVKQRIERIEAEIKIDNRVPKSDPERQKLN
jgi:hypothetical protein